MLYFLAGSVILVLLLLLGRWMIQVSPSDLVRAVRTFIAVASGMAGMGLLFFGRVGLAIIVLSATFMAVRSLMAARAGPSPIDGEDGSGGDGSSKIETDTLAMALDHRTGALEGSVRTGPMRGRTLGSMTRGELLELLEYVQRADTRSVSLLEAYLDRTHPDWREASGHDEGGTGTGQGAAGSAPMDEKTALAILGLQPGAGADEIKDAHRRLMAKIHPDRGGSDFLASQINAAKEFLIARG